MKRWMIVSQTANRPLQQLWDAFKMHGRQALQGGTERALHADGSFLTRVHVPGYPLTPPLRVTIGVGVHRRDGRIVVPLGFGSEAVDFAYPQFEGAIEFEPLAMNVARVSIVGTYVPPLGPIGAAIDAAMLRRAADATASALLARMVDGLLQRWDPDEDRDAASRKTRRTVSDVMTVDPLVVDASLPLKTTALLLFHLDVSGAPVVQGDGELVGVVTERDLLDKEAAQPRGLHVFDTETFRRREAATAGDACSRPARTTAPNVTLHEAVAEMQRCGVGRLVVVDQGGIVGIVTRHDVLLALIRNDAEILHVAQELLRERGETQVEARVDWGIVSLAGKTSLRSHRDAVVAAVGNVDGAMGLDTDDLHWEIDDVLQKAMPPIA